MCGWGRACTVALQAARRPRACTWALRGCGTLFPGPDGDQKTELHTHTHLCVCVCVCVCTAYQKKRKILHPPNSFPAPGKGAPGACCDRARRGNTTDRRAAASTKKQQRRRWCAPADWQ